MDTIYIGFREVDIWYKSFLKKGFTHCFILIPCVNYWLEIDPLQGRLYFARRTDKHLTKYTKILRVNIYALNFNKFPIKFFSCVKMVEYMLGKNSHATTPYGLYKKLIGKLKNQFKTQEIM